MRKLYQAGLVTITTLFTLSSLGAPAAASQAAGRWFDGHWRCTLDGRATKMRWLVKTDRQVSDCRFDANSRERVCTSASGIKTVGEFWDRNGPWAKLSLQRSDARSLTFRHADGNVWFLQLKGSGAEGWSTWNQKRYPLRCSR